LKVKNLRSFRIPSGTFYHFSLAFLRIPGCPCGGKKREDLDEDLHYAIRRFGALNVAIFVFVEAAALLLWKLSTTDLVSSMAAKQSREFS
jgi:hypothetical protein